MGSLGPCELPRWWRDAVPNQMPLDPIFMHSAVRIIGDRYDPKTDRLARVAIGTGFLIVVPSDKVPDIGYGYLVTAHHVVEDQSHVEVEISDPHEPGGLYPRLSVTGWCQPIAGLDLALASFLRPADYFAPALVLGENLVERLPDHWLLGSQFHYVGLLAPLDRIMARSGTIGAVAQEGVVADDDYCYSAHLADCRSYGGYSGSPCFIERLAPTLTPVDASVSLPQGVGPIGGMVYRHLLCGMFTGHLEAEAPRSVASRVGVGFILTSDDIWRALMTDDLVQKRRDRDKVNQPPHSDVPTRVKTTALPDEFRQFEDLTRKLVNVPKKQIDEKRKGEG